MNELVDLIKDAINTYVGPKKNRDWGYTEPLINQPAEFQEGVTKAAHSILLSIRQWEVRNSPAFDEACVLVDEFERSKQIGMFEEADWIMLALQKMSEYRVDRLMGCEEYAEV